MNDNEETLSKCGIHFSLAIHVWDEPHIFRFGDSLSFISGIIFLLLQIIDFAMLYSCGFLARARTTTVALANVQNVSKATIYPTDTLIAIPLLG